MSMVPLHMSTAVHAHLDRLNPEQRAAVLHGDGRVAGPLLIIAGAGSGKTNTLAHRLSHLVLEGADPRRILLMTFSRRAAAEMTRRAERIAGEILGPKAAILTQGLTWTGTFHSIGSRLLREYAPVPIRARTRASPSTERGDAADLMKPGCATRLGFSNTPRSASPARPASTSTPAARERPGSPGAGAPRRSFAWCARLGGRLGAVAQPDLQGLPAQLETHRTAAASSPSYADSVRIVVGPGAHERLVFTGDHWQDWSRSTIG